MTDDSSGWEIALSLCVGTLCALLDRCDRYNNLYMGSILPRIMSTHR